MSTKAEELARVWIDAVSMSGDPRFDDLGDVDKKRTLALIDKFLQALETPDEMMVDAGAQMILGNRIDDGATAEAHFAEAWRAAIRAARAEQ